VKRMALYNACKWCRSLAGTYFYNEVKATGNDVWRRHRSCRCYVIDYHPGKKPRNAHTKEYLKEFDEDKDTQEVTKYVVDRDRKEVSYKDADDKIEKALDKKSNEIWKSISEDERESIMEYSGEGYNNINKYLRGVLKNAKPADLKTIKSHIKNIDNMLSKNTLSEDLILHRGVGEHEFAWWLESDNIDSYKSTSIYLDSSDIFGDGHFIKIYANKNTKGYYLDGNSDFPDEKEFLLHRGQKYRILKQNEKELEVEIIDEE
ncbi:MAG: ADP-ribosyltransferase, partial [Finegoldia sp.]|nr:ADP-ribosyltransferase [Finegoldia sp.]